MKEIKRGGGSYTIIGEINCDRCHGLISLREVQRPTNKDKKKGFYYSQYSWCNHCGYYDRFEDSLIHIDNTP